MGGQRSPKHTGKIHLTPEQPGFLQALVVPELVNGWIHLKPEALKEIKKHVLSKFGEQRAAAKHFGISQATMSERLNGRKGFIGTDLVEVLTEVKMMFSAAMVQEIILRSYVEPRHNIILELTAKSVYAQGIGMPAIRALFDIGHGYLHKLLHKYEQFGLLSVRSKSDGVKKAGQYAHYTSTEVPEPYLTTFVQDNELSKHQSELLIAIMLLTDGYLIQRTKKYSHSTKQYPEYSIGFFGKNKSLHDLFVDLMFHAFRIKPSTYIRNRGDDLLITEFIGKRAEPAKDALLKISPSYKTKPYRDSVQHYLLNEPQPSLQHVLRADLKTKILAFRIGMSCEGSVSLRSGPDERIVRAELIFGCVHPILAIQWIRLTQTLEMPFNLIQEKGLDLNIVDTPEIIVRKTLNLLDRKILSKYWSGVHGFYTNKLEAVEQFKRIGGFIPGVEVASYSKFVGYTKNQVMHAIFEYRRRVISGKIPHRPISRTRAHKNKEILKIIANLRKRGCSK
ncbi:MAG: hypothetical protein ACE5I5_05090 [Candidatus Heimdallarchaeota archaeon]